MKEISPRKTERFDRRFRRALRAGLLLSLLLHAGLFLLWRGTRLPRSPFSAAGPQAGDDRAAAGGGMRAVKLAVVAPAAAAKPPRPVPVPDAVAEPKPEPQPQPQISVASAPAAVNAVVGTLGSGDAARRGPGRADGTGQGAGGTEAEGRFRVVPPSPRGLILPPPDRPKSVRGKEIAVWVFVSAAGDVVSDSTRLDPTTGNRGFDNRLRDLAAEWVFEPARRDGRAVAEWFRYVLVM